MWRAILLAIAVLIPSAAIAQLACGTFTPPPGQPVITNPATLSVTNGTACPAACPPGLVLSEANSTPSETFTFNLVAGNTLTHMTASGVGVTGSGTNSLHISNTTLANVNNSLGSLTTTTSFAGSDTITLTATDSLSQSATPRTIALTSNSPPQPPVINVPGSQSITQNTTTAIPLSGTPVNITETNAVSGETFSVTLADTNGLLAMSGTGVTNSGTTSVNVNSTLANVNAALATLTDTSATLGRDTIVINASDSVGGVAGQKSIAITVINPGGGPVISATSPAGVTNGVATPITGVSLAGGVGAETLTLEDTSGELSCSGSTPSTALASTGIQSTINTDMSSPPLTETATVNDTVVINASDSSFLPLTAAQVLMAVTVSGGGSAITWDPTFLGTGNTLSNSNLTVSNQGPTQGTITFAKARSTTSQTAGKFYFEVLDNEGGATNDVQAGIGNASVAATGGDLGGDNNSVRLEDTETAVTSNNAQIGTATAVTNGQTFGIAVDLGAQLIWYRNVTSAPGTWNAGGTANPATGVGGYSISNITCPCYIFGGLFVGPAFLKSATLNAGPSFGAAAPSGFTTWGGSGGGGGTTLDPTAIGAGLSLSNGNLTASMSSSGGQFSIVRSTNPHSTGQFYYETTVVSQAASGDSGVGVLNASAALTGADLGGDNNGAGVYTNGSGVEINGVVTGTTPVLVTGHTFGIALDLTNKLMWVRDTASPGTWNAGGAAAPGGTGGISISAIACPCYAGVAIWKAASGTMTANFTTASPPTGFGNW